MLSCRLPFVFSELLLSSLIGQYLLNLNLCLSEKARFACLSSLSSSHLNSCAKVSESLTIRSPFLPGDQHANENPDMVQSDVAPGGISADESLKILSCHRMK